MNYKDGRSLKIYNCKKCNKEISVSSALYGSGLCKSCSSFKNGLPKCVDCGIELKTYHSKRCRHCANSGKLSSQFKDGRTLNKNYANLYTKNRRKIDISFRITGNLRSRIRVALKGICKSKKTIELLGCSLNQLKNHLQSKFQPGMSFSNYGSWHIDHIIPCVRFNLSKVSEQRKCFHYTNLQPLWAKENFIKNKY